MNMVILGIDPGSVRLGYGVVTKLGGRTTYKASGLLPITKNKDKGKQLLSLYDSLEGLISKFNPEFIGMESLFFTTNKKTAMDVSEARGVALLAIAQKSIPYTEYTPTRVKSLLTGDGKAPKESVARIVRLILGGEPKGRVIDDELDALAVAIIAVSEVELLKQRAA